MPRTLSLRSRTMLLASFAVGAILVSDAVIRLDIQREAGRTNLAERAALLASMQADAMSVPLWNLDDELVRSGLSALARDPDFAGAEIVKSGGDVVRQMPSRRQLTAVRAGAGQIEVARPINYVDHGQTKLLGQLRLGLRTDRLQAALSREAWQQAAWLVLLLSAMVTVLAVAFRQLSNPLDLLAGALGRLASGETDVEVPALHRTDEIGAVARGLQVFKDTAFQLVSAQAQYRAVYDHAVLGIFCLDANQKVTSVNAALLALTGDKDAAALQRRLSDTGEGGLYVDQERRRELFALRSDQGGYVAETAELRHADGRHIWITQTSSAVRDAAGHVIGYVGTAEDITDRRRRTEEERMRIRAAVESAADAMLIADADGAPLFVNRAFSNVLGYDLAGLGAAGGFPKLFRDGAVGRQLAQALKGGNCRMETELCARHGRAVPMAVSVAAISDEHGAVVGSVAICTDLSGRRAAEAQIAHMARHDPLTGLLNRVTFNERLQALLASSKGQGSQVAVLCLDIERFKEVNDTLGHAAGDDLLQQVAARLNALAGEATAAARIDGDEFMVMHLLQGSPGDAEDFATDVMVALSRPYRLGGSEVTVGLQVGLAVSPHDGYETEELLRFAGLALCEARAAGSNTIRRFSPEMDRVLQHRTALERDLRRAVANEALVVHYQPQCRLSTGDIVGAEALLRWTHPERGPISPADFIPIAEQTGLISTLGEWVLRTACRTAASWPRPLRVAVNISPLQFRTGDLVQQVRAVLAETGLPARRLELEITEGVMLHDTEATLATLHELKAIGVRLAMDDFGTGYSSLSYLRRMPIDKIKIDQSFVRALGTEPAAEALVRSIIGIGRGLGIEANAEGVETEDQAKLLRREGCHEVQGWHFGRPQPAEAFAALLTGVQSRAA